MFLIAAFSYPRNGGTQQIIEMFAVSLQQHYNKA
jgi:hypothetical protein